MNSQNNDDSMNFSVIEPNAEPQADADFSVRSLLGEEEEPQFTKPNSAALSLHRSVQDVFCKMRTLKFNPGKSIIKNDSQEEPGEANQFLRALARMQKELSFESTVYNVYEDNQNTSTEMVPSNKSKTYSCMKTTKEQTIKSTNKSTLKEEGLDLNQYYGPLVIDFKNDHRGSSKNEIGLKSRHKSKNFKLQSKNSSNMSSQYSQVSKKRDKKIVKSKSKDDFDKLFGRDKSKSSKNNLAVHDFKRSKSKSQNSKFEGISKSQNNLKISSQTDNHTSSKVFTEYYGTEANFYSKKSPDVKMAKKQKLQKVKSREKSSGSRSKLTLLSPRNKPSAYTVKRK